MNADKAHSWNVGDPCPACGGQLAPYRTATDAEYAASIDKENPKMLPACVDSAAPAFVAENGALHVCQSCGYHSRVAPAADAADDSKPGKRSKTAKPATDDSPDK